MAWQQEQVKEVHAQVLGPSSVASGSQYGVAMQPNSSRMNGILGLSYRALKSVFLNEII